MIKRRQHAAFDDQALVVGNAIGGMGAGELFERGGAADGC